MWRKHPFEAVYIERVRLWRINERNAISFAGNDASALGAD